MVPHIPHDTNGPWLMLIEKSKTQGQEFMMCHSVFVGSPQSTKKPLDLEAFQDISSILDRVADDNFSDRCWCRDIKATIKRNSSCRNSCGCVAKGKISCIKSAHIAASSVRSGTSHNSDIFKRSRMVNLSIEPPSQNFEVPTFLDFLKQLHCQKPKNIWGGHPALWPPGGDFKEETTNIYINIYHNIS
jgi:hypothetical protein